MHVPLELKCLELIPSSTACFSVTLGGFPSLRFDFPIYKMYVLHRVVERIKCVTLRGLVQCLAHRKHSEVRLKIKTKIKKLVSCVMRWGGGCEMESVLLKK